MAAGDLCTLEDVKAWLNLVDNDEEDALLERLISAESARCGQFMNRPSVLAQDFVLTLSGNGQASIFLPHSPINSVSSVSIDGSAVSASVGRSAGFFFGRQSISLIGRSFTRGANNVTVAFNSGFETAPADISQACIELVCYRYRERDRIGHTSKSIGPETVAFQTTEMPDSVKQKLRNYARVSTPSLGF